MHSLNHLKFCRRYQNIVISRVGRKLAESEIVSKSALVTHAIFQANAWNNFKLTKMSLTVMWANNDMQVIHLRACKSISIQCHFGSVPAPPVAKLSGMDYKCGNSKRSFRIHRQPLKVS